MMLLVTVLKIKYQKKWLQELEKLILTIHITQAGEH